MTIGTLAAVVRTADKSEIFERLQQLGYIYCNQDKQLGKVGIVELVNAITFETEDLADCKRKKLYNGRICRGVIGYENYEFILVNTFEVRPSTDPFDDEETAVQTEMLVWAKKINC
ncbi:MAG: hypothetical protein NC332_04600 [Firmicutes bacterium]|nr:hypothetical protein [Bacillota bacterium]